LAGEEGKNDGAQDGVAVVTSVMVCSSRGDHGCPAAQRGWIMAYAWETSDPTRQLLVMEDFYHTKYLATGSGVNLMGCCRRGLLLKVIVAAPTE